eukprot:6602456-Ditylum_brightwellii.AAC.1
MGTLPAVAWATLFFAIKEERFYSSFEDCLAFYAQYIDNIFGIWTGNHHRWAEFIACVDNYHDLQWKFSDLCNEVDFLDITLTMHDNTIQTTLFEK